MVESTFTISKDVFQADNAFQETPRLWLEAVTPLTAIVDKVDSGKIKEVEIVQGIKNILLFLGNVSQQHSLQ